MLLASLTPHTVHIALDTSCAPASAVVHKVFRLRQAIHSWWVSEADPYVEVLPDVNALVAVHSQDAESTMEATEVRRM